MGQSQSETLSLLLEVGRLLSSKLDLAELLRTVLETSSRVVGAESASLLLVDEKTGELYFDVALGLGQAASKVRLKPGQGIAGSVAKDRKGAIINDVRADPRWSPDMDKQSGFVTRSILATPMLIKGRIVGVIEAINKRQGVFTPEDLSTFEAFASQASVAVDNARLFSSLKAEKFKLDTVFAEMTDGAILADPAGHVLLANPAARKFLRVGTELVDMHEALHDMACTPSLRDILASDAQSHDFAVAREHPKKLILTGKATRLTLGGDATGPGARPGAGVAWLFVFRDETEEWMKERLKRTFLSLISHKLKTPLTAVTGFADILLDDFRRSPPGADTFKAVQSIALQGRKLADLVDRLLRYTTLENDDSPTDSAPVPMDDLVADAVESLRRWLADDNARVVYEPAPGIAVLGDKAQLSEVVRNLIENAVKFDPKPEKVVTVWAEATGEEASLHVKDTGPGIPPEEQDKIFSQFHQIEASFTGQIDGWGLGMPFIKKIVERHGGRVVIKSMLGEGTTVSVILPRPGASPGGGGG